VLGECDGVISGYLGTVDVGEAVIDIVARVKGANPAARYCCDPVIGDVGRGVFVRRGVPELIKERALPMADFATPNQFELDFLSGRRTATLAEALAAIETVHALGPRVVLATSLRLDDTPADALDLIASDGVGRFRLRTPLLPLTANGAGDLIAALFFAHHLSAGSAARALSLAASSLFGVLSRTADQGSREMLLVDAQEEFVHPSRVFHARLIS
jgi:pyridoxine kinase